MKSDSWRNSKKTAICAAKASLRGRVVLASHRLQTTKNLGTAFANQEGHRQPKNVLVLAGISTVPIATWPFRGRQLSRRPTSRDGGLEFRAMQPAQQSLLGVKPLHTNSRRGFAPANRTRPQPFVPGGAVLRESMLRPRPKGPVLETYCFDSARCPNQKHATPE